MPDKNPATTRALARRTSAPVSDFDQVFEALWNRAHAAYGFFPSEGTGLAPWTEYGNLFRTAATDVVDNGPAYQIKAEVPGISKDQIDIRVNGTVVEISAEDKSDTSESSPGYLHRERYVSRFHRAFELPEPVVAADAKAKVVNGVLELELPKEKPAPEPVATQVKVE